MLLIPAFIFQIWLFFIGLKLYFAIEGTIKSKLAYCVLALMSAPLFSWIAVYLSILSLAGQKIYAYHMFFYVVTGPALVLFMCMAWLFYLQAKKNSSVYYATLGLTLCLAGSFLSIPWFAMGTWLVKEYGIKLVLSQSLT